MKPVCCLFAATLGLVVTLGLVRADSSDPNQPINPYTQTDANGTPLGVLNPNLMPLSDEEKQELQKERDREQEKAALDKDWLVRYYEQAVQSHPGENLDTSNIYYEFSTNPELAKLAGMPELAAYPLTSPSSTPATKPSTSQAPADSTASNKASAFSSYSFNWKPLIAPLSTPETAGIAAIEPPQIMAMASPLGDGSGASPAPAPKPAPTPQQIEESLDLETPGMVASKNDPNAPADNSDLTLDLLPGETEAQAKADREKENSLELPRPMTVDQLHNSLATLNGVPTSQSATNATSATPPKPAAIYSPKDDPDAPIPVNEQPVISPVHAPIANPFDILNR